MMNTIKHTDPTVLHVVFLQIAFIWLSHLIPHKSVNEKDFILSSFDGIVE